MAASLEKLRRRRVAGIYVEAWQGRMAWVMSYVRPLSYIVGRWLLWAIKELAWKILGLSIGAVIGLATALFIWLALDFFGVQPYLG